MLQENNVQSMHASGWGLPGDSLGRYEVVSVRHDGVDVVSQDGTELFNAICAASCLLEPAVGDQVLIHRDTASQDAYILAVLVRPSRQSLRQYVLSESVRLQANHEHLQIHSTTLGIQATSGEFKIDQFSGIYQHVSERANSVSLVANQVKHSVGRFFSRLRDSFRLIEGVDRTQAANIHQTAEHQILLKSDMTKIRSEHVVKVDAKKIDLG